MQQLKMQKVLPPCSFRCLFISLCQLFALPGFPPRSMRRDRPWSSSPKASGSVSVSPLTAQEAQKIQSINTVPHIPPLLVIPTPRLHHTLLSCTVLWHETLQSCFQQAVQCTSFPSPNSSFTSGLKFHQGVGNPKWAQSGAMITSTAHGRNSSHVDAEVCSCQSRLWHLITVTLHRIFQ